MANDIILSIENLSKSYSDHQALKNLNLAVKQNSIFGLLGPNGAGKTTLIRILTQIYSSDKGKITLYGEALNSNQLNRIGYLPEERGLYKKMFVEEHLVYLGQLRGLSKKEILSQIDFWFDRLAIQDWRKKLIGSMSKGMQQKVQFIASFLHNPDLIILDEPFSGFDPVNAEMLKQEIIFLKEQGKTILYSTHRMESVEEICDEIALINQAECIYTGSVQALKQQHQNDQLIFSTSNPTKLEQGFSLVSQNKTETIFSVPFSSRAEKQKIIQEVNQNYSIISMEEHNPSLNEIFLKLVQ